MNPDITETEIRAVMSAEPEPVSPADDMEEPTLLREAQDITSGDRNQDYDHPYENMKHFAALFNAQFGHALKRPFRPDEMTQINLLQKLSRMRTSPTKRDHYVDIAGWSRAGYVCVQNDDSLK